MTQWVTQDAELEPPGVAGDLWASEQQGSGSPAQHQPPTVTVMSTEVKVMSDAADSSPVSRHRTRARGGVINERDIQCGAGSCTPRCMQPCANIVIYFIALFALLFFQGINRSYISAMLSTIERRFELSSKQLGLILIMDNIGNLGVIIFLAYYGGKARRPLINGLGLTVTALGSFLMTIPHYIFGPGQTDFSGGLSLLKKGNGSSGSPGMGGFNPYLCNVVTPAMAQKFANMSAMMGGASTCDEQGSSSEGIQALTVFCIGYLLVGAGGSGLYSLGVSYLDDNVPNRRAPVYLGVVNTGRFLGPIVGFVLFRVFGQIFVDPSIPSKRVTYFGNC